MVKNYLVFMLSLLMLNTLTNEQLVGFGCNIANCMKCSDLDVCGKCDNNFILKINSNQSYYCQQVSCNIKNCSKCLKNDTCQQCKEENFLTMNNTCQYGDNPNINCPSDCLVCNEQKQCQTCSYGYKLINTYCYIKIQLQIKSCKVMMNTYGCQICQQIYMVGQRGDCILQPNFTNMDNGCAIFDKDSCTMCRDGQQLDQDTKTCKSKTCTIDNCALCDGNNSCSMCEQYYIADQNNTMCHLYGYSCNIDNCQNCFNTDSCGKCKQSYTLQLINNINRYGCRKYYCSGLISNCQYCLPNLNKKISNLDVICSKCLNNYNLVGGYCLPNISTTSYTKPINCQIAVYDSYCQDCSEGYFVVDGQCIQAYCSEANCAKCRFNNYCEKCNSNFAVVQGRCLPISNINCSVTGCNYCLSDNTCGQCRKGFKKNSSIDDVTCESLCSIPSCYQCENQTNCKQCNIGYKLSEDGKQCLKYESECENCLNCSWSPFKETSICSQCKQNYILYNGQCFAQSCNLFGCNICASWQTKCIECKQGLKLVGGYCQGFPCSLNNCSNCLSNPDKCTTCDQGFYLNTSGNCTSYSAHNCTKYCKNCNQTSNSCMQCIPGYDLHQGNCVCKIINCLQCSESPQKFCNKCPFPLIAAGDKNCQPMPSISHNCNATNCIYCYVDNSCSICAQGYKLVGSTCNKNLCDNLKNCSLCDSFQENCFACQEGYMQNQIDQCQQIAQSYTCSGEGCLICSSNSSKCSQCQVTYKLQSDKCKKYDCPINCRICIKDNICSICDGGYYLNSTRICAKSNSSLKNCDFKHCIQCSFAPGTTNTVCTACQQGYQISKSECVAQINNIPNCKVKTSSLSKPMCQKCQQKYRLNQYGQCQQYSDVKTANCSTYNCLFCHRNDKCGFCLGLWQPFSEGVCSTNQFCDSNNCQRCSQPSLCTKCKIKYQLLSNNTCLSCDVDNCARCSSADLCENCLQNYTLSLKQCILCQVKNCKVCSRINFCSECQNDLVLNLNSDECVSCNLPNCSICSEANKCSICEQKYIKSSTGQCFLCINSNCKQCSSNNTCQTCQTGYSLSVKGECFICASPCLICNNDNKQCATCKTGYSLDSNKNCYRCGVIGCSKCTKNSSLCDQCLSNYNLNDKTFKCQFSCVSNCTNCTTKSDCSSCADGYTLNSSNACVKCSNDKCKSCNKDNKQQCLQCFDGFYIKENDCFSCTSILTDCILCNSSQCTKLSTTKKIIIDGQDELYCDYGCISCAESSLSTCKQCQQGLILDPVSRSCKSCSSPCKTCDINDPKICFTCYTNYILKSNTCQKCNSNCFSCDTTLNNCTTCELGYYLLNNNTCNSCSKKCLKCSNTTNCLQCQQGYSLKGGRCLPCSGSCQNCANGQFATCLDCGSGLYKFNSSICKPCSQKNCQTCSSTKCTVCQSGYILNQDFSCRLQCSSFCSNCSNTQCTRCAKGYKLVSNKCQPNTTCPCTVCPFGYILDGNKCQKCGDNCARCQLNDKNSCTNCNQGYYLDGTKCEKCNQNCSTCINGDVCVSCNKNYTSITKPAPGIVTCLKCEHPCLECTGQTTNCLDCQFGFTLQSSKCVTKINFEFSIVFSTSLSNFYTNYLGFIQFILTFTDRLKSVDNITISSIFQGSVNVTGFLNSFSTDGSQGLRNQNTEITQSLISQKSINGMIILSSSIKLNGNLNPDDNNKDFNNSLALILGICIPIAILIIVGIIILVYFKKKKNSDIIEEKIRNDDTELRNTFELSKDFNMTGRKIEEI